MQSFGFNMKFNGQTYKYTKYDINNENDDIKLKIV